MAIYALITPTVSRRRQQAHQAAAGVEDVLCACLGTLNQRTIYALNSQRADMVQDNDHATIRSVAL
jgi:hypothetical protein